jgi:hypothetical protein
MTLALSAHFVEQVTFIQNQMSTKKIPRKYIEFTIDRINITQNFSTCDLLLLLNIDWDAKRIQKIGISVAKYYTKKYDKEPSKEYRYSYLADRILKQSVCVYDYQDIQVLLDHLQNIE